MDTTKWIESKPYWLKSGIIGLIIGIIFSMLSLVPGNINEVYSYLFLLINIPTLIVGSFLGFFIDFIFNTGKGYESMGKFIIIIFGINYFFIGIVIGLIISKIKLKKLK